VPKLLEIDQLTLAFEDLIPAIREVTFSVDEGERVALVGESGSGKSVTAQTVLQLNPAVHVLSGSIRYANCDLLNCSKKELQRIRGREIGFVFQDPFTALNPTMKVGKQIIEGMRRHLLLTRHSACEEAVELLEQLEFKHPREVMEKYPFELSGGMRQRILLAIAVASQPKLLIADEPTTALDVSVQLEILRLLKKLSVRRKMGLLLITHDLTIIPNLCDKVVVMYAGEVVETGDVKTLWESPQHPYTQALLRAIPTLEQDKKKPLSVIPGNPPLLNQLPKGCCFQSRCSQAFSKCAETHPSFENGVRCWKAMEATHD